MQGLCESAAQPSAVRLLGWLVSWRVYTAMVSGCWSTSGSTRLEPGPGPEREREREFKANNAVNFKRRIPSINVNTRFINLHTKHTLARTQRQRQRKRD